MINGLDISYKKQQITRELAGSGLYLTKKGNGFDQKCNKKKTIKKQQGMGLRILK